MKGWRNELIDRVLQQEDHAEALASRLCAVAARGPDAALTSAVRDLQGVLEHELEAHLLLEERELFPALTSRGLGPEVATALEQHATLRRLRAALKAVVDDDAERAVCLGAFARELERHVRFEADFLYADLRAAEAEDFRRDVDTAIADDVGEG